MPATLGASGSLGIAAARTAALHEDGVEQRRHGMRPTTALVAAAFCVVLTNGAAVGGVVAAGPEGVLDAYAAALSDRDAAALDSLLADDYDWVIVNPPEVNVMSRDDVLTLTRSMLADENVEGVRLTFDGGYSVESPGEPGSWFIRDVRATLGITMVPGDGSEAEEHVVTDSCMTFYVRLVPGMSSEYEIYREVNFEGVGCDGE